jgi:signal transduction histidine kinase
MQSVESELGLLREPRLAALATSAWPAWLWSTDATQIRWANAAGVALFGASDTSAIVQRRFDASNQAAAQAARLAATLLSSGAPRLERLRGFGTGFGRALTCACSRIVLSNAESGILIAATEPAGPTLSLSERVRRLFSDDALPLAFFNTDGTLIYAAPAIRARLGAAPSLSVLGLNASAAKAIENGSVTGTAQVGDGSVEVLIECLGDAASRVVVVTLPPPPLRETKAEVPAMVSAPDKIETPPVAEAAAAPVSQPVLETEESTVAERRHPLRFVWQMDAEGRFVVGSDEFIELVGPRTMASFGRKWSEIAAELKLDPDNQIARAISSRETWSGIVISWPVDETSERLPVELSGLPVFDRDRSFRGYRGFGVCRDIGRINQLLRERRDHPVGLISEPDVVPEQHSSATTVTAPPDTQSSVIPAAEAAPRLERPSLSAVPAAANVVPFRQAIAQEAKPPALSAGERRAFRELAQELTARLRGTPESLTAGENGIEGALAQEPRAAETAERGPVEARPSSDDNVARHASAPAIDPLLLDRIPIGVLVYRHDELLYANRHFLECVGFDSLDDLAAAGGLNTLFVESANGDLSSSTATQSLSILTRRGDTLPVDGRLLTVPWNGASALALILANGVAAERRRTMELALAGAETELRNAKRETQRAAAAKADFLSKVSHDMRTPLNTITGFAEVIMSERFGPIGNERYSEYLKNIHEAGTHLVSLLNDMLDLSKVETGKLNLNFANISLNDLTQQCVGIMQPQASRARIIIRTAITKALPQIVADERSLRQIVINLLANSIKFTGPGGQVIVSTAVSDSGEIILRVRDTGVGMTEQDIETALEPYRQSATSGSWGSAGTGLGLPLTKALAEANRANFSIKSAPNAGTLVEVAFPHSRVASN